MSKGGSRNRSGPPTDPTSGRSDRRGIRLTALPSEGYAGEAPRFPLPRRSVYYMTYEEKRPVRVFDEDATEALVEREREMWEWAWTTPQACAWAQSSESWRLPLVAMWVRTFVICESSEATAADKGSLHRFADQIGMTPAGLRENGWAVAVDEVSAQASGPDPAEDEGDDPRNRLTVVSGGGA